MLTTSTSVPAVSAGASPRPLIEVTGLTIAFGGRPVVHDLNFTLARGEALGMVGESGCGKSVTWLGALGLLPRQATVTGSVKLDGVEILNAAASMLDGVRGRRIALISQDPTSSLNPVMTVGRQVAEAVALHRGLSGTALTGEVRRLLDLVGIPDAAGRMKLYPHELSGGQNQRVMIAAALAGQPDLLVADEPTTALDATIQAQILELIETLRRETGMAVALISHDLGVIAQTCERVLVMYSGRIVEQAPADPLFDAPRHPYTRGLLNSLPRLDGNDRRLMPIPGQVPAPGDALPGCAFEPRCPISRPDCTRTVPPLTPLGPERAAACLRTAEQVAP